MYIIFEEYAIIYFFVCFRKIHAVLCRKSILSFKSKMPIFSSVYAYVFLKS